MSIFGGSDGPHFKSPWLMYPGTTGASNLALYDNANGKQTSDTVAFFTGLATYGVTDSTNWVANTYKSIYSHTGMGLIYLLVGPTAGGAETTTFEITLDGVLSTVTITNASSERALLSAAGTGFLADFTSVNSAYQNSSTGLDAGLTTFQSVGQTQLMPMGWYTKFGVGALRYNQSALVRMKHSAIITNSTATAYSGVMVRKGIAA